MGLYWVAEGTDYFSLEVFPITGLTMGCVYRRIGGFQVTRGQLPPGVAGVTKTLALMRRMALEGSRDVEVREAAISAVRRAGVAAHDHRSELFALFQFVRDGIRFTRDIHGVETLQSPRYTLELGAGDCDDRATLLAALARSIGLPVELKFRVVAANPGAPGRFSHVYVTANMGGRVIALDPTYPGNRPGFEPPNSRVGDFPL
jgi:transglutaminase-like putative cysteine protease